MADLSVVQNFVWSSPVHRLDQSEMGMKVGSGIWSFNIPDTNSTLVLRACAHMHERTPKGLATLSHRACNCYCGLSGITARREFMTLSPKGNLFNLHATVYIMLQLQTKIRMIPLIFAAFLPPWREINAGGCGESPRRTSI